MILLFFSCSIPQSTMLPLVMMMAAAGVISDQLAAVFAVPRIAKPARVPSAARHARSVTSDEVFLLLKEEDEIKEERERKRMGRIPPPPPPQVDLSFWLFSSFFTPGERRIIAESFDENRLKKFERKVDQTKLRVRTVFNLLEPKSMRAVGCGSKGRDENRRWESPSRGHRNVGLHTSAWNSA